MSAIVSSSDSTDDITEEPTTDFRGSRRLVGAEEWFWYLAAAITYILLGIWHKWLLNWFVGPAWLVAFIVIGPWLTDRIGLTSRHVRRDGTTGDVAR
ncbi:hypothetical protein YM304_27220 [Ilumatobacter coccineus YM16-304]|uniref:Uncharacterized protein n=1 Tax=Ilumatobacter coccineus (strain NBRC 103263 / KCTC 29153 / YM16-304) TaxID=1313172 RepID=A0A6C7EGE8_ILUCY|nr:hypothetical protein YM304_27220 [Ilumatobacter coccineus YM16-304]